MAMQHAVNVAEWQPGRIRQGRKRLSDREPTYNTLLDDLQGTTLLDSEEKRGFCLSLCHIGRLVDRPDQT
jgi:hypothetical protein